MTAATRADSLSVLSLVKADKVKVAPGELLGLLGLLDIRANEVVSRSAIVAYNGRCRLRSASSISNAIILGRSFALLDTPLTIPVLDLLGLRIGTLYLNATIGGLNPTIGAQNPSRLIQRAIWLHITAPLLVTKLADVIIGEAEVGTQDNPCA